MKTFTTSFDFQLPDGTTNADARLFIQEALMRFKSDVVKGNPNNTELSKIVLPKSNDITIQS